MTSKRLTSCYSSCYNSSSFRFSLQTLRQLVACRISISLHFFVLLFHTPRDIFKPRGYDCFNSVAAFHFVLARALLLIDDSVSVADWHKMHKTRWKTCNNIKHVWFVRNTTQCGSRFITTKHETTEIRAARCNHPSKLMILLMEFCLRLWNWSLEA